MSPPCLLLQEAGDQTSSVHRAESLSKASCTGYIETSSHVVFTPFPSKAIHLDQLEMAVQDTQQESGD